MPHLKKVKSARGGKRQGAGRRPKNSGANRTILRQCAMTPETWARVESAMLPSETFGDFIERIVPEISKERA